MRYFALVLALFIGASAFAQNKKTRKADELFSNLNFQEAALVYKKALKKDNVNTYLMRRLADCYANTGNYNDASEWYAKCIYKGGHNKEDAYYYGQTLIALGKFERGTLWMNKYMKQNPTDVRASVNGGFFDVTSLAQAPENIVVKPMKANGNLSMLAPMKVEENLVIAIHEQLPDDWEPSMRFVSGGDLFVVKSNKKHEIKMATPLSGNVVSDQHELAAYYNPIEELLYVTRVKEKNNRVLKDLSGHPQLEVACYSKKGNTYQFSHLFEYNSNQHSIGFVTINPKDNKLYFSSNNPNGKGGFDINVCVQGEDGWGKPCLLETCNTSGDEVYLNFSNGMLYFASNGWPGLGGLDQFSYGANGILNIGAPFNSSSDDYGIFFNNSSTGYFSSGRTEGKGDDLILFEQIDKQFLVDFNLKNGKQIPFIHLKNQSTGLSTKKYINDASFSCLLEEGVEYSIKIPGKAEPLLCRLAGGTPHLSQNHEIQWDAKLQEYYKAKIADHEHTGKSSTFKNLACSNEYSQKSNQGKLAYLNFDLSADPNVANANLILKDLDTGAVKPVTVSDFGKGEAQVIEGNRYALISGDGMQCYMRTDQMKSTDLYSYEENPTVRPKTTELNDELAQFTFDQINQSPNVKHDTSDFPLASFHEVLNEEIKDNIKTAQESNASERAADTVIKLDAIYFGYNKANISEAHANSLMTTAEMMSSNMSYRLEIRAHTDSRGSSAYNEALSQKRAVATKEALINLGIDETRLQVVWLGESETINGCTDKNVCEESLHKMNRRAELNLILPESLALN